MHTLPKPIIMQFPVEGEWSTPNTPGTRIPSHGTNILGTRYAYDFLQVNWLRKGKPCYQASFLHYLVFGLPLSMCYCYGKSIYSPCDGTIIKVHSSSKERTKANVFSDIRQANKHRKFDPKLDDVNEIAGNHIILKYSDGVYVCLCHLQPNSIIPIEGQRVHKGDLLACIGHTGNSTFPHLHFQLMDSPDVRCANGLLCAFTQYEVYRNGVWEKVYNEIPKAKDRIRYFR